MDELEQSTLSHAAVTDRFMSRFIDFETVAGDTETGDAGDTETAAAGTEETSSGAVTTETTETAAAETTWAPSREDFERLTNTVGFLAERVQGAQTQTTQTETEQPTFNLDPLGDNYEQELARFLEYRDQQMFSRFEGVLKGVMPVVQSVQEERGDAAIAETLEGFKGDLGDFDLKGAKLIAEGMLATIPPEQVAAGRVDPNQLLRQGAEHIASLQKTSYDTGFEAGKAAYKAELEKLGGAARTTSTTGAGVEGEAEPGDELEAAMRYVSRNSG